HIDVHLLKGPGRQFLGLRLVNVRIRSTGDRRDIPRVVAIGELDFEGGVLLLELGEDALPAVLLGLCQAVRGEPPDRVRRRGRGDRGGAGGTGAACLCCRRRRGRRRRDRG